MAWGEGLAGVGPRMGDNADPGLPVRVAVRVRPICPEEVAKDCGCAVEVCGDDEVRLEMPSANNAVGGVGAPNAKRFTFDVAYDDECNQKTLFDHGVKDLVAGCLEGYNATVLAYGQTGSGKTYTMGLCSSALRIAKRESEQYDRKKRDLHESLGILPRACNVLFQQISQLKSEQNRHFRVRVSCLEIYQENVRDLLQGSDSKRRRLRILDGGTDVHVEGATEIPVNGLKQVLGAAESSMRNRATGSTEMNARSSRSHAIFTFIVEECTGPELNQVMYAAKLHLVDLAGSERNKRSGAVGERFQESIQINQGLLSLGNVISILGDKNLAHDSAHVPYRQSKLTRLLRDSLGGNSRTLFLACVSPADENAAETSNTLKYANRARNIKNKPIVNAVPKEHFLAVGEQNTNLEDKQTSPSLHVELEKLLALKNSERIKVGIRRVLELFPSGHCFAATCSEERERQRLSIQEAKISLEEQRQKLEEARADLERDEAIFANKTKEIESLREHLKTVYQDREQLRLHALELEQENQALLNDSPNTVGSRATPAFAFSSPPPPPDYSPGPRRVEQSAEQATRLLEQTEQLANALKEQLEKSNRDSNDLQTEVASLKEQLQVSKHAQMVCKQTFERSSRALDDRVATLQAEKEKLIAEYQDEMRRGQFEKELLVQEKAELLSQLEDQKASNKQLDCAKAELASELVSTKKSIADMQEHQQSEKKLNRLDQQYISSLEKDARHYRQTITELKAKIKLGQKTADKLAQITEEHTNLKNYLREHARLLSLQKHAPSKKSLPVPVTVPRGALQEIPQPKVPSAAVELEVNTKESHGKENVTGSDSHFTIAMATALKRIKAKATQK